MRRLHIPFALLAAACLSAGAASAQHSGKNITKDETVIIHPDKGSGRTVLEIKDGTVYVNGEAVVTVYDADAAKVHKKIIIENGNGGGSGAQVFNYPDEGPGDREMRDEGDGPARNGGHRRAMLGVLTDPKSAEVGAMVKDVTPGSAAEKAGLQKGDVITRLDGKSIKDAQQLVNEVMAQHEPGDRVTINYERGGEERSTTARLGSATPQVTMRGFNSGPGAGGEGAMPGDMPNSFFRQFSFPGGDDNGDMMRPAPKLGVSAEDRADGDGVKVLSVKPGSAAAAAGLKEGDVIMKISGDKIGSVDELQRAVREGRAGERMKLEYQRNGKMMTTDVTLPKTMKRKDL